MRWLKFLWLGWFTVPTLQAAVFHVSAEPLSNVAAAIQFRTINEAAKMVSPGDTVSIHAGVYQEAVVLEKSGTQSQPICFEAVPGENVVITGVDHLRGWRQEAETNVYSTEWPYRFITWSKTGAYPEDEYHRLIGRAEQVLINNSPLQQTLQRDQLPRGSFFVDLAAKRLYVSPSGGEPISNDENSAMRVEAATRSILWHCKGEYITTRGLSFRYAANHALEGAGTFDGRGDVAEDCVFEGTNATGASFTAPDQIARRCIFQQNGQFGFITHRAHNLLVSACVVRNNNTKGFNRDWGAGGNKLVLSRGVILEKSQIVANHGPGIWFDIGNENCTVRNCVIADNEDAGIFYEISYALHAHDNVITGNGFHHDPRAWGAQAGIVLSSSPNCVVKRNLLIANREGFNFREQSRTTKRIDQPDAPEVPVWNHDEKICNNVIAYNVDAQTRGWFAVGDRRHWPRALQEKQDRAGSRPAGGAPAGERISLEKLNINLSSNLYATQANQPLFIWGTNWQPRVTYSKIGGIQAALNLESASRLAPPRFYNYQTRDFRVPPNSPAVQMGCYPQGSVPDVSLGLATGR